MIIAFLPISFCTFVLSSGAKQRNIYNQLQLWFPFPDTKKTIFFVMSVNFFIFWQLFFLAFHHKTIIEYLVVTLPGAWLDPDSFWMTASQKGSCPGQGISKMFSIPLCCVCLVHTCVCLSKTSLVTRYFKCNNRNYVEVKCSECTFRLCFKILTLYFILLWRKGI